MSVIPLGHSLQPLTGLREAADNPRSISPAKYEQLKHTLREAPGMLEARPLIVTPWGEILAGNMRHRALTDLAASGDDMALTQAPVFCLDPTDDQRREIMLLDNQSFGRWDDEKLAAIVAQHAAADADLQMLGFGDAELAALARIAVREHERAEPTVKPPVVDLDAQAGDVLLLGTHRLTVGPGGVELLRAIVDVYRGHAGADPVIERA